MGLLEWEMIKNYNYKDVKENVDIFMYDFLKLFYKYINITPKSLTSQLKEVVVDYTRSNTSYIEEYVEKKDEFERKYLDRLNEIINVVDNLSYQEQHYIKGRFFKGMKISEIEEKLQISDTGFKHVIYSASLKIALAFDLIDEEDMK
jgi:DNA-directed RNA polymerase specialized sigma subunit